MSSKQDFSEKEVGLLSSRLTFGKNSVPRRQSVTLTITPAKTYLKLDRQQVKAIALAFNDAHLKKHATCLTDIVASHAERTHSFRKKS